MALVLSGSTTILTHATDTNNIGLGANAVDSITTGDYNVGIGDDALTANTAGNNNTGCWHWIIEISCIIEKAAGEKGKEDSSSFT